MQTAIVVVIALLAAFYLVHRFYHKVRNTHTDGCQGDCGCCSQSRIDSCPEPDERK
jgi:hypothetical protein